MTDLVSFSPSSDDTDPLVRRFAAHLVTVVGNTTPSPRDSRHFAPVTI